MIQEHLKINDVELPVIIEEGIRYFPISYTTVNILKRAEKNSLINKNNRDKYKEYIKEFEVEFNTVTNIQVHKTKCISEDGLKIALSKTKQGRLSIEQRESQNLLHKELGIKLLIERELYIHKLNESQINEHEEYVQEIIRHEMEHSDIEKFHLCPKCDKYYPMTNAFFRTDSRTNTGYYGICIVCDGKTKRFTHPDKEINYIRDNAGIDAYEAYKEGLVIPIYEAYLKRDLNRFPECFLNREDYLKIIEYLHKNNLIDFHKDNLTDAIKKFRLTHFHQLLSANDVYTYILGNEYYLTPWKFSFQIFKEVKLTYDMANVILRNYINEFKVHIENIFTYNYDELMKRAKIRNFAGHDLLYFIVQFYNFKYPGYMFRCSGVNYYKTDENLKFDLRYLIEEDMKLEINKIPLYLTKFVLQKRCSPLYNQIIVNKNHNLFYWIDQLYPNVFTETDFEINAYRSEFDSDTECFIHEILTDKFRSVIYNQKHTDRTIVIDGMIPDWLVFTDKGVWIIEYFGMYVERQYDKSSRIRDYIDKTHKKIEKYNNIKGYNFIFLYPYDIDNDFKGCREKLREIEEGQ